MFLLSAPKRTQRQLFTASCLNLKKPLLILTFVLFFSIVGSMAVVTAQDTVHPLLTLSSTELTFYLKENGASQSVDLTFVGLAAGGGVNVRIVPSKLYDNTSGEDISITSISENDFDLIQNDNKNITLTLDPSGFKAGTYEGVLIITATNKTTTAEILTTNIKITAKIESAALWYESEVQIGFIIGAIAPIFIGLGIPDKEVPKIKYSKRFWLVVLGAISVSFWLVSIVTLSFKEPGTIINTVLVTPFLTYVVSFVKDKRTERLEAEKTSRTIRDDGIKEDVKLIRNLIGEMATHCASFGPNFYAKKMQRFHAEKGRITFDYDPRLLYPKTGLIERKVWDNCCRQGFVADIHTLHLEKYYDFVPLYNQYYSEAMTRVKDLAPGAIVPVDDDEFFTPFEAFREKYSELQKVLFVYLTYILELYSRTTLTPMKVEYPRITRTLLYKLIEYHILIPWDFIDGFRRKDLKEFGKKKLMEEMIKDSLKDSLLKANSILESEDDFMKVFKKKYKAKASWLKKFKENKPELREGTDDFEKGFDEWLIAPFMESNPDIEKNSDDFKERFAEWKEKNIADVMTIEDWLTKFFENRIEWWLFTADELDRIVEYIYEKDRIPHFFRHVQDDFQKTFIELKECIKALPKPKEIPKDMEIKEYKVSLANTYKEDKESNLKPDPLRLVLNAQDSVDTQDEPSGNE